MRIFLVVIFIFTFFQFGNCQDTLRLNGNYQGKNIYVENPYASNGKGFCAKKVFVNDSLMNCDLAATAFEINLNALNLKTGAPVKVEIIHGDDCRPKIFNGMIDGDTKCLYDIISIEIKNDSLLLWTSHEMNGKFTYNVEQFRWNKWIKIGEVGSTSGFDTTSYTFNLNPYFTTGKNEFRVKVVDWSNKSITSKPVDITKPEEKDFFDMKTNQLYYRTHPVEFKRATMWELYDQNGNIIRKGNSKSFSMTDLPRGEYFLNYDNSTCDILLD